MAARRSARSVVIGREVDCGSGADRNCCRCRNAVERAFAGMIASGAPDSVAREAATRVFLYHHPESSDGHARDTVETWLFTGPLH